MKLRNYRYSDKTVLEEGKRKESYLEDNGREPGAKLRDNCIAVEDLLMDYFKVVVKNDRERGWA